MRSSSPTEYMRDRLACAFAALEVGDCTPDDIGAALDRDREPVALPPAETGPTWFCWTLNEVIHGR